VHGSQVNLKITQPGDLELAEFLPAPAGADFPDGSGNLDRGRLQEVSLGQARRPWKHESDLAGTRTLFKPGVPLRIGGMTLDHPEGLAGHSDGDVLLHAITDALLGAVAAGDIGSFFPPGDPRWKDADSAIFLNLAMEELAARRLPHCEHRHHADSGRAQDRPHRRRDARASPTCWESASTR
jgi:hypothetical protein